jgi:hypothetical protein
MSDERLSVRERKYGIFQQLYDNGKYSAALELLQSNPKIQSLLSEKENEGMREYCEGKGLTGVFAKLNVRRSSDSYELNEYNPARDCGGRYSFSTLVSAD